MRPRADFIQPTERDAPLPRPAEHFPFRFAAIPEIYAHGLDHVASTAFEESSGRDDFDAFYECLLGEYRLPDAPKGAKRGPRLEEEEVLTKRLKKKYPALWDYEAHYD